MKIFLDSADINEIKTHQNSGFVDGVTTNPSLIAKSGRNILETIAEICTLVDGPVSAEVTATDFETMLTEGRKLAAIAPNVAVKVPVDGSWTADLPGARRFGNKGQCNPVLYRRSGAAGSQGRRKFHLAFCWAA
jgi:transaldolase